MWKLIYLLHLYAITTQTIIIKYCTHVIWSMEKNIGYLLLIKNAWVGHSVQQRVLYQLLRGTCNIDMASRKLVENYVLYYVFDGMKQI